MTMSGVNCTLCGRLIGTEEPRTFQDGAPYHVECWTPKRVLLVGAPLSIADMAVIVLKWSVATIPTALLAFGLWYVLTHL